MHAALERAVAALCFGPALDPGDRGAIEAWLERAGVAEEDREHLVESGIERLLVYRELVRSNLREALEAAMPRTIARLGALFDEYFDGWLSARGPRTHYLRDVTEELLDYVEPLWAGDPRVPAWASDLARHEAVHVRVAAKASRPPADVEPEALDLERPVRFVEAVSLMRYDHAVHELADDVSDRTPPAVRPTLLLVYRSPEHEVRFLELSPLAHAMLTRLVDQAPLGAAVRGACEQLEVVLDEAVLAGTAALLHDLNERGALLGAARGG